MCICTFPFTHSDMRVYVRILVFMCVYVSSFCMPVCARLHAYTQGHMPYRVACCVQLSFLRDAGELQPACQTLEPNVYTSYLPSCTHTHTGKWASLVESLVVFSFLREAGDLQSAFQALEAYVASNSLGLLRPQPPVETGVLSTVAFV
jgi:hypothetical protein